jgi:hypothetical protein
MSDKKAPKFLKAGKVVVLGSGDGAATHAPAALVRSLARRGALTLSHARRRHADSSTNTNEKP